MTNILRIDTSIRETGSYSRALADKLIMKLSGKSEINITRRDLLQGIPYIDENWMHANFTPLNERTALQHKYLANSDLLVDELKQSDLIVIALPIYNFGVPAAFKAWIDQVVRAKLTFQYGDNGPQGLLKNKKAYVIVVSGGTELGTEFDFISEYIKHVLGFIGITDIVLIDSSGLGRNETKTLAQAHDFIDQI